MAHSNDFLSVRINTLKPGQPVEFDLYIHFKDRNLLYKKTSEVVSADLIEKFRKHSIRKIFIRTEHEPQYLAYLDRALQDLEAADSSKEQKTAIAVEVLQTSARNIDRSLDNEQSYQSVESQIDKINSYLMKDPTSVRDILTSSGLTVDTSQHAANVATLASALAVSVGIKDPQELLSISVAALLHDLGKDDLGLDPMKPDSQMSPAEKEKLMKHPDRSVARIAGKRFITPRILRLVADHEELCEGRGYPERKNLNKLPLSSQVFNLCNRYDHLCIEAGEIGAKPFSVLIERYENSFPMNLMLELEKLITPQ